jgi:hypothetical protein
MADDGLNVGLASWQPNDRLGAALAAPPPPESHRYLFDEQNRAAMKGELLGVNQPELVAMALRGCPSKVIAAAFGVSREAVDKRLRALGLKNPPGIRGKPKSSPAAPIRS